MPKISELIGLFRNGVRAKKTCEAVDEQDAEQNEMVTQRLPAQKRLRRLLLHSVPLGILGLTALALWITLPRFGVLGADLFSREDRPGLSGVGSQSPTSNLSLAVVNPNNVERSSSMLVPQIETIAEKNGDESVSDTLPFVTATPDDTSEASSVQVVSVEAQATPASAADADASLPASEQQQTINPQSEATVDPIVMDELLEPLLQDQINPTPLVIELEIPTNGSRSNGSGLGSANLQAPSGSSALPQIVLLPTATPTGMAPSQVAAAVGIPLVEIVPAVGVKATPTATPPPTPTPVPEPTVLWSAGGPERGRPWSSFRPRPPETSDHFWVGNPFSEVSANGFASPNYQFGSTAGGRYRPHHGVDISNPSGTPVRAGVTGEVVFAGPDDVEALGPYNNFYGNAVVVRLDRRLPVAGGRLDVFVLYGHLSQVDTTVGSRVEPDDVIGRVGMTGIAIGPHLHVEIRLGANTYSHNVNPFLWMTPRPGSGAVAVRVLTNDGKTWAGAKVSIARFEGGTAVWARQIETYLDTENIGPDPAWGENGAMGDVPAGYYYLIGQINGESVRAEFSVEEGKTTFVEVRTQQ